MLIASSKFPNDSTIERLRFPANDVSDLKEILRAPGFGFEAEDIIDETRDIVMDRFYDWLEKADFNDLVLIYFSGHGYVQGRELFLTCSNTQSARLRATALPYDFIYNVIHDKALQKVAILLDCCYAGRAMEGVAYRGDVGDQVRSSVDSAGSGVFFLGASGRYQTAEEREIDGHGRFTKLIIDGLLSGDADTDGDGDISASDLSSYVKGRMDAAIEGSKRQGEFILGSNLGKKLEAEVSIIAAFYENNRKHFNLTTRHDIEYYLDTISRKGSDRVDLRKVFGDPRYLSLVECSLGRGNIESVARTFRDSRWVASFKCRGRNSFSIALAKGGITHTVEFRAKMLRTDQLVIDDKRQSALRWPGCRNSHKFVLGSNPSEQFG
jgi:hypothetical protein